MGNNISTNDENVPIDTVAVYNAVLAKWTTLWCDEIHWPTWLHCAYRFAVKQEEENERDKFLQQNEMRIREILNTIYADDKVLVGKMLEHLKQERANTRRRMLSPIKPSSGDSTSPSSSSVDSMKKYAKIDKLPKLIQQTVLPFDTLAAIVLTDHSKSSSSQTKPTSPPPPPRVLSIGTGTHCLRRHYLLDQPGNRVLHSHAVVIARRGLLRVLYQQLKLATKVTKDEDVGKIDHTQLILEPSPTNTKKFRLKPHLKLHLFTSKYPCGAASIDCNKLCVITDSDNESGDTVVTPRGTHEAQQITGFHSCSDKILLWNMIGLQGTLLSEFLEPIYLYSIQLVQQCGKKMENVIIDELQRCHVAIFGRFTRKASQVSEQLQQDGYKMNYSKIRFCSIDSMEKLYQDFCARSESRNEIKSLSSFALSHNWYDGCVELEFIDPFTGLVQLGFPKDFGKNTTAAPATTTVTTATATATPTTNKNVVGSPPISGATYVCDPYAMNHGSLIAVSRLSKKAILRSFMLHNKNVKKSDFLKLKFAKDLYTIKQQIAPEYPSPSTSPKKDSSKKNYNMYRENMGKFLQHLKTLDIGKWCSSSYKVDEKTTVTSFDYDNEYYVLRQVS